MLDGSPCMQSTERHNSSCHVSTDANIRSTSLGVTMTTSTSPGLGRLGRATRAIGLESISLSKYSHEKRPLSALCLQGPGEQLYGETTLADAWTPW